MLKNLTYLVEKLRMNLGLASTQYDQQFLEWFIDGYRKMNQLELVQGTTKSVRIPVVNHRANFPNDYNGMIRIGVCRGGTFIAFDKNDELCFADENKCPCAAEDINESINQCCNGEMGNDGLSTMWAFPIFGQPYSYSYTVGSYAIGPGFYHGGYIEDFNTRQFVFDNCIGIDEIVLEYTGDFLNDMGNALVTEAMIEPLMNYADWQRCKWAMDARLNQMERTRWNTWFTSLRDYNAKVQAMTKENWLNIFRSYMFQGNKA